MNDQQHSPTRAQVRLSPGSARDLNAVIDIMDAAFDDRFGEAWTRSQCAGILPMPGVRLVVARLPDETPVGFALYRTVSDDAELLLLAVKPDFRRGGVGRMLLDNFIAEARDEGSSRIHLEVREGNPAVDMYRRAGFSTAGRRRKYYRGRGGGEFDALTLTLHL
jgi:ribosomal-protein-alanine N-acetyltransferase